MAYYLNYLSNLESVEFSKLTLSGDFKIEVLVFYDAERTANTPIVADSTGNTTNLRTARFGGSGDIELRIGSVNAALTVAYPNVAGEELLITVSRVGATLTMDVNGTSASVTNSSSFIFDAFGKDPFSNLTSMNLKYVKVYDAGNNITNNWNKQTLSGSNDTLFPDTVGGNDGTLFNFPTDNSQWVFYSDSTGATADIDFSVSAPVFSVNASASLPQPESTINFGVSAPTFSVAAEATQPQPRSDISFNISGPAFSIGASVTLPSASADIDFSVTGPIFSIVTRLPVVRLKPKTTIKVNRATRTIRVK